MGADPINFGFQTRAEQCSRCSRCLSINSKRSGCGSLDQLSQANGGEGWGKRERGGLVVGVGRLEGRGMGRGRGRQKILIQFLMSVV